MPDVRVYLGSDHAGFELKTHLVKHLAEAGHEDAEDDYPPYCVEAARRVVADPGSLGVVIGGSGNGEQIAANKVPGCRAALAYNTETASLGRLHNDAQVVALGGRMHSLEEATAIVEAFLATSFSGEERHARRIQLLTDYERTGTPPPLPS
jgi:ribose 5-phosphate isomerase B